MTGRTFALKLLASLNCFLSSFAPDHFIRALIFRVRCFLRRSTLRRFFTQFSEALFSLFWRQWLDGFRTLAKVLVT